MGGLKEEIRAPIALHRPQDVAAASALALLQEEELAHARQRPHDKEFSKNFSRSSASSDKYRGTSSDKVTAPDKSNVDDKVKALLAHRKKNGLCFKCGEKWGRNHTCPTQVPIHLIEELLEALEPELEDVPESDEEDTIDSVMAVGATVCPSSSKRRTMRLHGKIADKDVLILVDSGSVSTFISSALADQLHYSTQPCEATQYMAADGSPMVCNKTIPQLQWAVQGHTFSTNVGIFPLKCYDMILGEDWLEDYSPMWVHWRKKIMRFNYKGRRITLKGTTTEVTKCSAIGAGKLKGLLRRGAVTHCVQLWSKCRTVSAALSIHPISDQQLDNPTPEVSQLLDKYSHLFQDPNSLPPERPCDHHIPLVPGAQPVNTRAYRFAPAQKTEIERQLTEMLKNGTIRPSTSPYASPVLLVRKKDGSWRFCVDYRHLNNITVKNKHPLPIVDELIDELAGAQWFSKLDFRSGYHQIRISKGEEHKTAFRTHSGLYEFLVMPFGLTNAPATFQGVMNQIFAPLLRKGVLVFMDDILIYSSSLSEHLELLEQVFLIIQQNQFLLKLSKCSFAQTEIEYLGHCISGKGVATEPSKIEAVKLWPTPSNLKDLRGFFFGVNWLL